MTFLNPIFLLGLVAAAIPLVIHLFNFRRPRRVEFSSLTFLRQVERSTMQRVRIKQWLLLALRTLAIASLVLAFARPTAEGQFTALFAGNAPASVGIVIDNTPSMALRDAQGEFLDQALLRAEAIIQTTDSRDEVALVPVHPEAGFSERLGPGGGAPAARLPSILARSGRGSLQAAVRRAGAAMESASHVSREIYVISDFQSSTLRDSLGAVPDFGGTVYLANVGDSRTSNIAVESVEVVSRIIELEQPVQLTATLVNHGDTNADSYGISVLLGDERVAQRSVDLPARVRTDVSLTVTPRTRGWLSGVIQLEDDDFSADDRGWFSLHVPEQRRLLLVVGDGQDSRYVETALSSELTGGRAGFAIERIDENQLAAAELASRSAVILLGASSLSSGEVDRLSRYVDSGGGLLWFAGETSGFPDRNRLLAAVGGGQADGLSQAEGSLDTADQVDLDHPLFEGMLEAEGQAIERPAVFRRLDYVPGTGRENSLITLSSGVPLLQEIRHGRGTVLLFTVAPTPSWTDLPTRGLFVPLLYRSIYLLSSRDATGPSTLIAGSPGSILLGSETGSGAIELSDPDGATAVPEARRTVGGSLISLDGLMESPGIYTLSSGGQTLRRFAVNPDPRESDLSLTPVTEAASILTAALGVPVRVSTIVSSASATGDILEAQRGMELWNVFLVVALLLLVAEMAVAKFWRPEVAT